MTPQEQAQFRILKVLEKNPEFSQLQLAQQLGVSAGKINYMLNALVEKGLIKIGNFHRAGKKLNKIAYLLTRKGMAHRLKLTQAYVERKRVEYEALKAEIEMLENESISDEQLATEKGGA